MELVVSPVNWTGTWDHTLFLGGGIQDCYNWQTDVIDAFRNTNIVLLNPRQNEYDTTDQTLKLRQVSWEIKHFNLAGAIMFWFPQNCLCRTTNAEYGKWVLSGLAFNRGKKVFVGVHPNYIGAVDIRLQTQLGSFSRNVVIESSLDVLIKKTMDSYQKEGW